MICDFCHENEAVIFLEEVSPSGDKRKINMCMNCAVKRGVSSDPASVEASLGRLFKEISETRKNLDARKKLCPVCGTSLLQVAKTKRAGCPECYSIFKDELEKIYSQMNVKGKYTGSMPQRLSSFKSVLNDRIMLQNKMKAAEEAEDYERAAMYRDYLRALEKQSVAPGGEE